MSFINCKVSDKKKSEIFWQENLHVPSFCTITTNSATSGICFRFSQFSRNFVSKQFQFYGPLGFLTCSSIDPWKPHSKTSRTHLSTVFWNWHSQKFSKMKVFVFSLYFQKFFFWLMPRFLRSPHKLLWLFEISVLRLLKNFNEILEKLPVFLKGLYKYYDVTSIYCHLWINFFVKFWNTEKHWNSF